MVDPTSSSADDVVDVDVINRHLVGTNGVTITVMMPPLVPMPKDDALTFAAWLVACADPMGDRFEKIMHKVLST